VTDSVWVALPLFGFPINQRPSLRPAELARLEWQSKKDITGYTVPGRGDWELKNKSDKDRCLMPKYLNRG